jgi:hypothetical protein
VSLHCPLFFWQVHSASFWSSLSLCMKVQLFWQVQIVHVSFIIGTSSINAHVKISLFLRIKRRFTMFLCKVHFYFSGQFPSKSTFIFILPAV